MSSDSEMEERLFTSSEISVLQDKIRYAGMARRDSPRLTLIERGIYECLSPCFSGYLPRLACSFGLRG